MKPWQKLGNIKNNLPLDFGFPLASLDFSGSYTMGILFLLFCHFHTEYAVRLRGGKALPMSRKKPKRNTVAGGFFDSSSVQEDNYQFKYWLFSAFIAKYLWSKFSIFWRKKLNNGVLMRKKKFSVIIFEVIRLISTALVKWHFPS